jgi:hypothetical protein
MYFSCSLIFILAISAVPIASTSLNARQNFVTKGSDDFTAAGASADFGRLHRRSTIEQSLTLMMTTESKSLDSYNAFNAIADKANSTGNTAALTVATIGKFGINITASALFAIANSANKSGTLAE